jgi:hypothetical protein
MNINIKTIFILLALLLTASNVSAVSVFTLPATNDQSTLTYTDNIQSEFKTLSQDDRITELKIILDNTNIGQNNTALWIKFENNASYILTVKKYMEYQFFGWGGIPYEDVTQTITFQNYTAYNHTTSSAFYTTADIEIDYRWLNKVTEVGYCDILSTCIVPTGFIRYDPLNISNSTNFYTSSYIGLPSQDLTITGLSKFTVTIIYKNLVQKAAIASQKEKLSSLSLLIYKLINGVFNAVNGIGSVIGGMFAFVTGAQDASITNPFDADNELLLNILTILDDFFWAVGILVVLTLTYPWLLIVWALIIGNFYVAWKSTSIREIFFNYSDYFRYITKGAYSVIITTWTLIMRVITAIIP